MTGTAPTYQEIIDEALAEGPIADLSELDRRAKILSLNAVNVAFRDTVGTARDPLMHPETRQVAARAAEVLQRLVARLEVELS